MMKYTQEQIDSINRKDLQSLIKCLQTPKTLVEIQQEVKIVNLQKKITQWCYEKHFTRYKDQWRFVYEAVAKEIDTPPKSRVIRPLDNENYGKQMALYKGSRSKTFVSGSSLSNFV